MLLFGPNGPHSSFKFLTRGRDSIRGFLESTRALWTPDRPFLQRNRNKGIFKIINFKATKDLSLKYRLTLDYKEDLVVIKRILANKNIFLNYKSIESIFKKNPNISKINDKYIGKMWYQKKNNS